MTEKALVVSIVVIVLGYKLLSTLIHHYFQNKKAVDSFPHNSEDANNLYQKAEELDERIQKLESILDKDLPGWRSKI